MKEQKVETKSTLIKENNNRPTKFILKILFLLFILTIIALVFFILNNYSLVSYEKVEQRARNIEQKIPLPPTTEIIAKDSIPGGGTSNKCNGIYIENLYGSRLNYQATLDFYRQALTKNGWIDDTDNYKGLMSGLGPTYGIGDKKSYVVRLSIVKFNLEADRQRMEPLGNQSSYMINASKYNYFYRTVLEYMNCAHWNLFSKH